MSFRGIPTIRELYRLAALPCRDASRLISQSMDQRLPWSQRAALRSHLWICRLCRRYHGQLQHLRVALRECPWEGPALALGHERLTADARARIKAVVRRQMGD